MPRGGLSAVAALENRKPTLRAPRTQTYDPRVAPFRRPVPKSSAQLVTEPASSIFKALITKAFVSVDRGISSGSRIALSDAVREFFKEKKMTKFAKNLLWMVPIAVTFSLAAVAGDLNQKTVFTFSGPVEVPGQVLPAGTYVFKLADSPSNRHIVQVFNQQEDQRVGEPSWRFRITGFARRKRPSSRSTNGRQGRRKRSRVGSIQELTTGTSSCIPKRKLDFWRGGITLRFRRCRLN